jgi:plasmid stability protein
MRFACYRRCVAAIQVRNVPPAVHEALRRRAAAEGVGLGEYVLSIVRRDLALPSRREWLDRLAAREPVADVEAADALAGTRAEREAELAAGRRP